MRTLVVLAALALSTTALAVPLELTHQGRLFDGFGVPLDGPHDLDFALYDTPSGGVALWTEAHAAAPFTDGYFAATLGTTDALDTADFAGDDLWLGVTVDSGAEIPDRLRLSSVPFAVRASVAESLSGGLDWTMLTGIPSGVDDGDDDSLAGITGCNAADVLSWDGSAWGCVANPPPTNLDASVITSGQFNLGRIPVGTSAADVAAGDHVHTAADVGALPTSTTAADIGALPDTATASDVGALDLGGGTLTGSLTVGDDAATCDSSIAGAIRWTGTRLEICTNDQWTAIKIQTADASTVPGLVSWVMGDAGVQTSSGTNVSGWLDQSGNGNDWVQPSAGAQPNITSGALNGLPVITHTAGSSDHLYMALNVPAPATVVYVGRMTGGASNRMLSGRSNNWLLGYHGGTQRRAYHEGWITSAAPAADTSWHMWTSVMTGSLSSIYEGRSLIIANANGVAGPNGLCTSGHLCNTEKSNGEIAEVAVYNGALSGAELSTVWGYLEAKWGI